MLVFFGEWPESLWNQSLIFRPKSQVIGAVPGAAEEAAGLRPELKPFVFQALVEGLKPYANPQKTFPGAVFRSLPVNPRPFKTKYLIGEP